MEFTTKGNAAKMLKAFSEDKREETLSSLALCWNEIYWLEHSQQNTRPKEGADAAYMGVALLTELIVRLIEDE